MFTRYFFASALAASAALLTVQSASADPLPLPAGFTNYKTDLASAGMWANMRKTDTSIASKSVNMVNAAFQASPNEIALTVAPNLYLQSSDDQAYCAKLSSTYNKSPLSFGPKQFASVNDFSSWFSDLSQGNGTDGSALYNKCDEDCSPSYSVTITKVASGYSANVVTFCNQPRDKDDDQYILASGLKSN